jgi:hypothetical protein
MNGSCRFIPPPNEVLTGAPAANYLFRQSIFQTNVRLKKKCDVTGKRDVDWPNVVELENEGGVK